MSQLYALPPSATSAFVQSPLCRADGRCLRLQKRAPNAHTVLEIVHARWGTGARLVGHLRCFALLLRRICRQTGIVYSHFSISFYRDCSMPVSGHRSLAYEQQRMTVFLTT